MQGGLESIVYKGRGRPQPMIFIADFADLVGPGLVRLAILQGLKEGWNPDSSDKSAFYLKDCPKDPHRMESFSVEEHMTEYEMALIDEECLRNKHNPTDSPIETGLSTGAYEKVESPVSIGLSVGLC